MTLLASSYDQSKYFSGASLQSEKKLKIKTVTEELVGEKREMKLIVWFTNDKRGLILNRVNNRTLRGAFGDAVKDWDGKIVVLFPTTGEYRGAPCPALRVRIPAPKSGNGIKASPPTPPAPVTAAVDPDLVDDEWGDEIPPLA
jgi:hypothetical protein